MNLSIAKRNLEPITREGKKIFPELTNDWEIEIFYSLSGIPKVKATSEILNKEIIVCDAGKFLKYNILNNKLAIENGKLIGNYAITKDGFLSENEYLESEDLIEINKSVKSIKLSKLKEEIIYKSDDDKYYLYIGEFEKPFMYLEDSVLKKRKSFFQNGKKYIVELNKVIYENHNTVVFDKLKEKAAKIKLISEENTISKRIMSQIKIDCFQKREWIPNCIGIAETKMYLIKTELVPSGISFIKYKDNYYIRNNRNKYKGEGVDLINDEIDNGENKTKYLKVMNINELKDFIKNPDDKILEHFLYNTNYYFGDENIEVEEINLY